MRSDPNSLEELLDFLDETPNKFAELIAGLSATEVKWKSSDAEFSALENLCHLRDLELQGYKPRIERILSEVDPLLADFDGARVAAMSDYNSEAVDAALQSFANARQENVRMLRNLTEEQLNREGTLEGVGKISLEQLAEKIRQHDEGHIEDLRVLRHRLQRYDRTP
jgi:hypothetical protein